MKWLLIGFVVVVVALGSGAAFFPMAVAADFVSGRAPDFQFSKASGSVWNGKLDQVKLGEHVLGDIALKTNPMTLFSGKPGGKISMRQDKLTGQGDISYTLSDGAVRLSDIRIEGRTSGVSGLPDQIRAADGAFTLDIPELNLSGDACALASGEVWTDALSKFNFDGDWVGPELRGPIRCTSDGLSLLALGESLSGEDVSAEVRIGDGFVLDLTAKVEPATGAAADRLQELGFLREGAGMVLRRRIGT